MPCLWQPSFGSEDRRRILDIFRERKKKRKQEKKKLSFSSGQDEYPENGESECLASSSRSAEEKGGTCGRGDGKENGKSNDNLSEKGGGRDFFGNGIMQQQNENYSSAEYGRNTIGDSFKEDERRLKEKITDKEAKNSFLLDKEDKKPKCSVGR